MRDYCARVVAILSLTMVIAASGRAATALELVPSHAPVGAYLVIVGSDLDTPDVVVTFTGPGGSRVSATPVARSSSLLDLRVPLNAISGDVRVVQGNATRAVFAFTLTSVPQFTKVMTLSAASTAHEVLKQPAGLFVAGRSGMTYVADTGHHQIRGVGASGDVRILAGTGNPGFVNGPAANAQFHAPEAVAFDEVRNVVYVADTGNHVIRIVTSGGVVQTLAGSGRAGDRDGTASEAGFDTPEGLALDTLGNLYVADSGNDKIRKITPAGNVTTVASGFKRPRGVAVAENGVVYVADTGNHVVRQIEGGLTSLVAGTGHPGQVDGAAAVAEFKEPGSLAIDDSGALLVADMQNHAIRRIVIDGTAGTVSTIAGTGQPGFRDGDPGTAQFKRPSGIAVRGAVYIADSQNDALRLLVPELTLSGIYPRSAPPSGGTLVRILGTGFVAGQTSVEFGSVAANDVTYISSTEVQVVAPTGAPRVVDVRVTTPEGTRTLADVFRYVEPPTIGSVAPFKGVVAGGQVMTISGTNFVAGETSVSFGGKAATAVMVTSSTTLTAVNPAHAAGSVSVSVTTPGGTAVLDAGFRYLDPPAITAFAPLQGRVGTSIAITGQHFDSDLSGNLVSLGGTNLPIASGSETSLILTVPIGATTGRLTITTAGGSTMSGVDFAVLTYTSMVVAPATASLQTGETLQFTVSGLVPDGTSETLIADVTWTSSNASIATIDASGKALARGDGNATITASYQSLSGSASVTVRSGPPLPPDPATIATPPDPTVGSSFLDEMRFLYTGPNAIQTGVSSDTIADQRAAVLRGRVLKQNGSPQPGVTISVLNHPEYGQTLSRADGYYDLVVNGGGPLILRYQRNGAIPAQRVVVSQWSQQRSVPDVVVVNYDENVTTVALQSATMQVARGSISTDSAGARRATLLFPANTAASLVLPDGTSQTVATLNIRATEFSVGATGPRAMPAALPPTSAYTYCVELSADEAVAAGAAEVRFSHAIPLYVENFLGFAAGGIVPAGYYDRVKGAWMSVDNGRVVKIVATTGGIAQIDGDGNGSADTAAQLTALGIDLAEQQQLALLYAPGQTLWRVLVPHLTPYDLNWPFAAPTGAVPPKMPEPEYLRDVPKGCKIEKNSTVDCHNQTLAEDIPVAGTPFRLLYDSGRVGAGGFRAEIPLTGATLPPQIRRVELTIELAGRTFKFTHPALPNRTQTFVWDGLDAYGRPVNGKRMAAITIGYVYPMVYASPETARAWASAGGVPTSVSQEQLEITLQQSWSIPLGALRVQETGFAGWMLSPHRFYDGRGRVLLDGAVTRSSDPQNNGSAALRTIADKFTQFIAPAYDGAVYIADETSMSRVDRSGAVSAVAGRPPVQAFTPDGMPAAGNPIRPGGIAIGPDGALYISEPANFRVRRIMDGKLVTVAGNGVNGVNSTVPIDGKLATSVPIANHGIFVGPDGTLYIAESQRVTAVGQDGIMRTIAGSSAVPGSSTGDGGPARAAAISARAVTVGADGSIYVLTGANTVRKITPDGIINRVAGPSNSDPAAIAQDGQLATSGRIGGFAQLTGLAMAPNDTLLLMEANFGNFGRIRAVDNRGVLTTFAGNTVPNAAPTPDGTLARAAAIPDGTYEIQVGPDGSVFFPAIFGPPGQELRVLRTEPVLPSGGEILIPSEDGTLAYVFENGRHVRTVETLLGSTVYSFSYDVHGYLFGVTDADGNVTRVERDAMGTPTAIVAPGGQRTTLAVSGNTLVRIANPAGETNEFTYDGALMTSRRDPRGYSAVYTYDGNGRLKRDADPAGGFISLVRSGGTSFTVERTSAEGRTHRYDVTLRLDGKEERLSTDPSGSRTLTVFGDGSWTSVDTAGVTVAALDIGDPRFGALAPLGSRVIRMPSGKTQTLLTTRSATLRNPNDPLSLATSTDVFSINARRYTTTFEAATRRRLTTSPAGRTELAMLDGRGRVVSAQVSGLAPISIQYGANGYVESVATGARLYRVAYNARRELTSITDPALRTTSFVYDTVGRLTANIFPDGRSTAFGYDLNGNVTAITPPGRATHRFTYTPVNLDDSYTPPALAAAGGTHFTYDRDRQLTAILYPGAEEVDIRQDAGGRPTAVIAPHGTYSLTYSDAMLTSISAPDDSRLDFAYDGSLMTSVTWSGTVNGTIEYSYDNDFRVVSENGVPFTFDADGFLTKAGNLTLTRNTQNGLLTGTSLQAVTDAYTYNEFGEVTGYTAANNAAPLLSVTYGRDDLGRISSETEQTSTTAAARVFEYDTAGRLVRVRKGGVAVAEYDYDANGNRTAHSYVGGSASATYDAQDRLLTYDRTTYTYSPRGDLETATTGGVTTNYGYDVFGNLRRVVIGDRTIEYVVDGQHRRVGKKVNGSFVAGWLYGDQLRVVAELDSTGAVVSRFVYGSHDSSPDYLERAGMMFRLLADRVGSPRLIVNAFTGAVVQRIDYDEFGRVVADTNPGFQPFGFAGGLYDRDTGFVRFGSRDYDPQTGRWTTKDQIGFESGHGNLYGYATSDPINFIDRDGRAAAALGAGGVAIVTGIVAIVGAEYLRQHPEMMRQLATSIAALADALHESGKSTTAPGRGRPGTREKYDVPECPLTDVPGAYKEWRPPQDECGPGGAMWLWVEQSPTWKDRIIRSIIATHYCANK